MNKQKWMAVAPAWPTIAALSMTLIGATPAMAQSQNRRYEAIRDLPREGYEARGFRTGSLVIRPELLIGAEYDSNVYATETNETDDIILLAAPRVRFDIDRETLRWNADAFANFRRYTDVTSEDSTSFGVETHLTALPSQESRFGAGAAFVRSIEDRGDPEARTGTGSGPRRYNDISGDLFYRLQGGRLGFQISGEVHKLNYLSSIDDERDQTSYRGEVRAYYRVSALISPFAQVYINRRDYRLATDNSGIDRDATTYGASLGVEIDPGGNLRGEANAGIFRFDPESSLLEGYIGAQVAASLAYLLTPRSALSLSAFRGDVGTVRTGATGRTDTRLRLGIEQEIRHNLLMNAGISWRQTDFRSASNQTQRKWGADAEIEYLVNRNVSVALSANYMNRNSDVPGEDYGRFHGGLNVRLKY